MNLYEKLTAYAKEDNYPFHMPGHKKNTELLPAGNPVEIDITEIDGFDNLHDAHGILKDAMERCARMYGADRSFFLVNGSTCGLLSGIAACVKRGDRVLVARNCHKSVYHAIAVNDLTPVYLYPEEDEYGLSCGIPPETVERMLELYPDARLVILVSPTYEGIVSDIAEAARIIHKRNIPLLVDEAHGAHFGFHPGFPETAVRKGADLVIQSVHKTLPAFTQSALLHKKGMLVPDDRLRDWLSVYQSSSPSYLLMAGTDRCMDIIEKDGKKYFSQLNRILEQFYKRAEALKHIRVRPASGQERQHRTAHNTNLTNIYDIDKSKIILSLRNTSVTGTEFYAILKQKYRLIPEMAAADYVLLMGGLGDVWTGYDRLWEALAAEDALLAPVSGGKIDEAPHCVQQPVMAVRPSEAFGQAAEDCCLEEATGRTAAGCICPYPPGIPIAAPGERIGRETVEEIRRLIRLGIHMTGVSPEQKIRVLAGRKC